MKKPTKPEPPSAPLKASPATLRPDLTFNAGPPRPVAPSMIAVVSGSGEKNPSRSYQGETGKGSTYQAGFYYNKSDLLSAMEKSEQVRAVKAQVVWADTPDANPARNYERQAANQRADLLANARPPMVTTSFAENSPYARF
jgi:hypothetical protein